MEKEAALAWINKQGDMWNEGNPWAGSDKIYDRLRARLGHWKALGASNSVISWLGYGVPMKFVREPKHLAFPNHPMDEKGTEYMESDTAKHLASGCFIVAPEAAVKVCNPILIIDQNGKYRRCDDCRHCNSLQANCKFCMGSVKKDVPLLVGEGQIEITRDLEKAYYKVPLASSAQAYAAFRVGGIFYFSMVMLFGMCQAPFFFTMICKPIARLFGALRLPAVNYIDDWFWSVLRHLLSPALAFITGLFETLGWSFNDKGQESTASAFLGFIIDTVRMRFVVPEEKRTAVLGLLREHALASQAGGAILVSQLRSTVGKTISMSLAIPGVSTWCRSLYTQIVGDDLAVYLSKDSAEELDMLISLLQESEGTPFADPLHEVEMWVDSGEIGWGTHCDGTEEAGQFPAFMIGLSSTARELYGLSWALKALAPQLTGKVVRVNMDSMCSVRNLEKGGGPVPLLCNLVKIVWRITTEFDIKIKPRWQRRSVTMMQRVDSLSKIGTEWEPLPAFIAEVQATLGMPLLVIDLARVGPIITALVRRGIRTAVLLPRWEAQSWWGFAMEHTKAQMAVPDIARALVPNTHGLPRWDFSVHVF
jgi:hypothetical protein